MSSGAAGAQAITVAFSPIITRLYGPEAFGLLGTFMAVAAVLTPVATLCYPIAIVLPKEDSVARGIAWLAGYISLIMALLISFVILFTGDWLVEVLRVQEIRAYMVLIPVVIFFSGLMQIFQQWLIRKKRFNNKARITVLQALILNSAKAGMGLFRPVAAVLIVLATFGSALHAGLLGLGAGESRKNHLQVPDRVSWQSLWGLAKKYYDFPVYRAPQVFINAVSQGLPILMLTAFFGPASAGFYVLGKRLLGMPSQLIGKSVGDVFYPRITEAAHNGANLFRLILKATLALAAAGFVPFSLVVLFGPWLFGFVFGSEWVVAGEYARWLALWLFFMFINPPAISVVPILGLQKSLMIYELFSTGSKLLALYIGFVLFRQDIVAIALFSICGAVAYLMLIAGVLIISRQPIRRSVV